MEGINEIPGGWSEEELAAAAQSEPMSEAEAYAAELAQQRLLLSQGVAFQTPCQSWFSRLMGKKTRRWVLRQPYLGTLDHMSREWIDLDFQMDAIAQHGWGESRRLVHHNARRAARILAMAVLNSQWGIWWLTGLLSSYLRWRLTPEKLFQLVQILQQMSNLTDFTASIRLMSVAPRTTAPARIEEPKRG